MTGPLVPVPDLPYEFTDPAGRFTTVYVGSYPEEWACVGTNDARGHSSMCEVSPDAAPALAAAILAATGCENHRVIDLGGPLPKVHPDPDHDGVRIVGGTGRFVNEAMSDEERFDEVVASLAVLEANATIPKHDPAEVEAVARALARLNGDDEEDAREAYGSDALAALDALAKVRAER